MAGDFKTVKHALPDKKLAAILDNHAHILNAVIKHWSPKVDKRAAQHTALMAVLVVWNIVLTLRAWNLLPTLWTWVR